MTTKGRARYDPAGEAIRSLPAAIAVVAAAGLPVVVEWEGEPPRHVRELYATLGVELRVVDPPDRPR